MRTNNVKVKIRLLLMKVAYNNHHQLVYLLNYRDALTLKKQNQTFFCPQCQQPVYIRITKKQHPYFAHQHNHKHLNESQQHQLGKQLLLQWCAQNNIIAKTEVWIGQQQQRADVLLPQIKHIFELQCSPLEPSLLLKRTECYHQYQYQVNWLLGKRYFLNKNYLTNQQYFINYHPQYGFYLTFLDSYQKELWCYNHLRQYDCGKCFWQKQSIKLSQLITKQFKTNNYHLNSNSYHEQLRQNNKLMHALRYQNHVVHNLQLACYQRHHHLNNLPPACYETTLIPPIFKKPLLFTNIQTLLWLEKQKTCTTTAFYEYYRANIVINAPLLNETLQHIVIKKYANYFLKRLLKQQMITININEIVYLPSKW